MLDQSTSCTQCIYKQTAVSNLKNNNYVCVCFSLIYFVFLEIVYTLSPPFTRFPFTRNSIYAKFHLRGILKYRVNGISC